MDHKPPSNPLLVVLGATGTGKSQLAIELAKRFNGEVINGDAMQLYHGLPIVTNKVTTEEMQGIPHHLLSVIPLEEESWRVGIFRREASKVIQEIKSRGKVPVLVGGTHYYTQSLVFGDMFVGAEGDGEGEGAREWRVEEIKSKWPMLESETEVLLERLRKVDPVMADRWHPRDRRKIRRSLEIWLMTGRRASDVYKEQVERKRNGVLGEEGMDLNSTLLFWVHAESDVLKKRLDGRVDKMLDAGMLDEVKSMDKFLLDREMAGHVVDRTRGIWVSIGWKEFEPYLKALRPGTATEEELKSAFDLSVEQMQAATRQYAKRQTRWIRLKLLPALAEENALKQLYLLDGTDVSQWEDNVSNPAINITADFLVGKELQPPEEVCAAAKEILGLETEIPEVNHSWPRRECEMCHVTAVTEIQWQTHLKSRKHRGLTKKMQKRQRDGVRGRSTDAANEDKSTSNALDTL
ncbi:related to tRNA isopentenyltransferase, mitochondrial precursor [Phialocephala subalpina]|uniref:tRNA dimethylallyltransferase n=1 Tax=Phialocephala subalpina TaxID=576137 RepID=A0A1L7X236_9HELO|nr:related to tRNA isopentenyltransferase, mitochondrial precursor [Phialocephala subalpina]